MRIFLTVSLIVSLTLGCQEPSTYEQINLDDPDVRNKILDEAISGEKLILKGIKPQNSYAPNSEYPYTGWAFHEYPNGKIRRISQYERGQERGLIPVTPPARNAEAGNQWKVGIDFGTSFTNFFIDEGAGPQKRHLETRVVSLTRSELDKRQRLLNQYFVPEEMVPNANNGGNPPTATAISLRGWQEVIGQVPELFHEARLRVPSPGVFGGAELRTGFKWQQMQYQKPYLKELALLISANAAGNGAKELEWSVSYPSAFSQNEVARYRRVWNELCEDLNQLTGLVHSLNSKGRADGLHTEAVAFASYFGNFQSRQMVHTSCLDVGGGTTDISIWQENRLIHQVSVPFAGRDISSKLLQRKPSFLKALFPSSLTADISDDEARARQDRNFTSRLDNIMRVCSAMMMNYQIHFISLELKLMRRFGECLYTMILIRN